MNKNQKDAGIALEITMLGLLLFATLVIIILGMFSPTNAQDAPAPYVCRTSYPTPRFEFHNLPTLADGVGWGIQADGSTLIDGVWIMDALTSYPDNEQGITAGMAVLSTSDYSFELRGDAQTPSCAEIQPTPEPAPALVVRQVISQPVVSTGRTCVIQYPKIILVCS